MAMKRRTFIKTGVIGGAVLAAAGLATHDALWGGGVAKRTPEGKPLLFLTQKDYQILAAIAGVILLDALPQEPANQKKAIDDTLTELDKALAGLQAPAQKELRELFGLLKIPPARWAAARVFPSWEKADPQTINAFLERWRKSRTALFRTAYLGLHQLIMGSWYGQSQSWPAIGYGGPPLNKIPSEVQ